MTQQEKNINTNNNQPLVWPYSGIHAYQELVQHNAQKSLQFWTDVLNFWWGKK